MLSHKYRNTSVLPSNARSTVINLVINTIHIIDMTKFYTKIEKDTYNGKNKLMYGLAYLVIQLLDNG